MRLPVFSHSCSSSNSGFRAQSRLASLDFKSFQRCVWIWLGASGYKHMRFCGRRSQRGRKAFGPDFLVRIGQDGMDVAVQVRHWKSRVSKRAVDELRGLMLRDGVAAGMIVASSTCSPAARFAAADFQGRPIRIIGVDRLCESLLSLGLSLDEQFFKMIEQIALGTPAASGAVIKARRLASEQLSDADFGGPGPTLPLTLALLVALVVILLTWWVRR